LARLHHVEHHALRTDLARRHPETRQMVGQAMDLAHYHARVLASLGRGDGEQPLDREREADVIDARGGVVEAVGIWKALRPGALLAHFFEAAMEVADFDIA